MMDERIIKFINKHHIFSLCTSISDIPYCCTCFYAYDKTNNCFYFTSEDVSRHAIEMKSNSNVAVNIALETRIIGKIQGLQLTGKAIKAEGDVLSNCRSKYLKRFPYALPFIKDSDFWVIIPDFGKFTDNNLGFGKKLIWNK